MIIKKSKIISVKKYFSHISEGNKIYFCVPADTINKGKFNRVVDEKLYKEGQRIIPYAIGSVTKFNLHGKYIVHKDMKKEKRIIEREYHIVDWHGKDHYGICFQPRMCYPKEFVLPPLEAIVVDKTIFRSDLVKRDDEERIKHIVNMMLEIFGYCEVVDEDKKPINRKTEIKEVNWEILPPGKYPWSNAEKVLENYFKDKPNKNILKQHSKVIVNHCPDFIAIGQNSFNGYVVYGYSDKDLYIFESNNFGNATYIFKGEWEHASLLTKYDIIQGQLCYKRIVHSKTWEKSINEIFEEN